ncbi:MAG: hypothetical protein KGN33_10120 [Paracoccaceae bacterium]|nr:hypothetical protein [Paracoccaceae bacterium]
MMFGRARKSAPPVPEPQAPVLDLSGPKLRRAFEHLVEAAEPTGGVERYMTALALKASLFEELLGKGRVEVLTEAEFLDLAAFITPARRRVGAWLAEHAFWEMRGRLVTLLSGWSDTDTADTRLSAFVASFPRDKAHRWVRDLGAEVLHFIAPDRYPLMTRWIWDARVGTGALREIWFADDPDAARIPAGDDYTAFRTLYDELAGFLAEQGVFRDLPFYTDLLLAHVYAAYINDRGGQYLRSDFANAGDPMNHTRRMLGLDAVDTETGRTRLKLIDGSAHVLGSPKAIPHQEAS